jgi:hypothetical protein
MLNGARLLTVAEYGAGGDRFALVVEARGRGGTFRASLAVRARVARRRDDRSGVWFPEEIVEPLRFFEKLRECGLAVEQSPR